jgi:hypothetical protein
MAKRWKPVTLGNFIQRVRVVFKHAADNYLIDRPVRYGQGFKRPSKKILRVERARQGHKLFTREELHSLLEAASVPLRAMILLSINNALGNADCGRLPQRRSTWNAVGWTTLGLRPAWSVAARFGRKRYRPCGMFWRIALSRNSQPMPS